ncbi:MAG TPA: dipeptide epimerase [Candidatus Krumholzibacteria bacterium]|nr:dipeptide epimerase [Candidatus Krumholzibacteria bacterium]
MRADGVVSVDVIPVDVPLTDPFVIARGALAAAACAFVRVRLADGSAGYGEIAPFTALTGETRDTSVTEAQAMAHLLVGTAASEWVETAARLAERHPRQPAARAGLECALVDACARSRNEPLYRMLGGADVRERVTDMTLPILAESRIDELAAGWYARGFRTFKLKVGIDPDAEARRVERLATRFADITFILDANQGFEPAAALSFTRSLVRWHPRIDMLEQPVARDDLDGMARLRSAGVPIAADESVFTLADARRVIAAGAADIVNLKITKTGFAETLEIARAVRAAGLRLMIGGMMETRLAMAFSFAIALGLGGIDFLDLDTPLLMADDPLEGGYRYDGPRLQPWSGAGVAMAPRPAAGFGM